MCLSINAIASTQIQMSYGGIGSGTFMGATAYLLSSGSILANMYNNQYTDFSSNVASGRVTFYY